MSEFREIITKAVVGKGRKYTKSTHTCESNNEPTSILGCWVINHSYEARKNGKHVEIEGFYDVNTWYSFDGNTKTEVVTERVNYTDEVSIGYRDKNFSGDDLEIIARVIQPPNCLEALVSPNGNKIVVTVEREFVTEVVGETKICVSVNPEGCVESDDDFQIADDEFEELDPNFIVDAEEE
ncbi:MULTISPECIES: outer spore coat protein CotE [Bacillus]|jgi:spore coat protein E|uniref:Spore coat protein E n=31 Tax=Bacillus cereus group TaxID=86661 RepID=Q81A24_BACCR|nr:MULTISPECIES: outer spore coat protein CotE [Bacillus]ANN33558.1 spore coat protein [Bacillus thuringiensis serovar coreanensis]EHP3501113.1 outer spore coat protein CotE [Escherichia coli]MBS9804680.1 outer spore coat protein CotE [Bacillus toyonensis]MCO4217020.1 outer spore coat protein CotE [Bacillus sp. 10017]MCU7391048.1 outer spore coat protein CotE [Bacillus sp. ST24]MCX2699565.1 outer spore coat protein CotE [Bacillus sp. AS_5]MDV8111094.1 outer spore coat protein CotE [Bacillus 